MSQINNNNGIGKLDGVSNKSSSNIPTNTAKVAAQGSGNTGAGISSAVGEALINNTQDAQLSGNLAKANSAPAREGLSRLALKVIFGDQTASAAQNLLPSRASASDQALLAGALSSENYQQMAA